MNSRKFDFQIRNTLLIFCLMLFGLSVNSFAASGDLDLSFGNGGIAYTSFAIYSTGARAAAVQPDGKIVVVGSTSENVGKPVSRSAIARYNPDGTLDSSFATGGKVFHRYAIISFYTSVALQPDGKILAAGGISQNGRYYNSFVVRYNTDGTLDASFGNAGLAIIAGEDVISYGFGSVLLQSDGKIVAVNASVLSSRTQLSYRIVEVRKIDS